MYHIFVDLEATCWSKKEHDRNRMETIEIGAVKLDATLTVCGEFCQFIRPVLSPQLSHFCRKLTTITQAEVDNAPLFAEGFGRFVAWATAENTAVRWYSWGKFDRRQLHRDCARLELAWPKSLNDYVNLKQWYAKANNLPEPIGMRKAMRQLDMPFVGQHHRGIDDARNLARVAQRLLGSKGNKQ